MAASQVTRHIMSSSKQRRKQYAKGRLLLSCEIPPAILERDEQSSGSTGQSSTSSYYSTFEDNGNASMMESSYTSSSFHTSRSSSMSAFSSRDSEDIIRNVQHWAALSRSRGRKSSTSHTGSTFEEVESLDLAGVHELSGSFDIASSSVSNSLDLAGSQDIDMGKVNFMRMLEDLRRSCSTSSSGHVTSSQQSMSSSLDTSSDICTEKKSRRRTRELIIPDENETEQFPFAKHVFNKKDSKKDKTEKKKGVKGYQRMRSSLFDQLMQYKLQHQLSESSQSTQSSQQSPLPTSDSPIRLPFENDYDYYVRVRHNSTSSSTAPPSSVGGRLSRTISMDSSSSSNVSSGSPDPVIAPSFATATAEEVLMNLGFCGQGSFLPERFARDWYAKIITAKQQREQKQEPSKPKELEKQEHSHKSRRGAVDFLHKLDLNSRTSASSRRAKLRRAATTLTQPTGKQGNTEVEKQDSIDQLKTLLVKQTHILQSGILNDASKDKRRKAFASSRQKSLPVFLGTLKEEDENRVSRGPSLESPVKSKDKVNDFQEVQAHSSSSRSSKPASRESSKDSDSSREVYNILSSNVASKNSTMPNSTTGSFDSEDTDTSSRSSKRKPESKRGNQSEGRIIPPVPTIVVPTSDTKAKPEKPTKLNSIEPAMVSIVLSDTEEEKHGKKARLSLTGIDDNLLSPSSVSPCPLSPVTVIEVDQLDNQNLDSTDSGDNVIDSPEGTHPVSPNKHVTSPTFPMVVIEAAEGPEKYRSCSIEADDRALSPLSLLPRDNSSPHGSESSYASCEEPCKMDESIQADDGTLSPILFNHPVVPPAEKVEFYTVHDAQTQSFEVKTVDAEVQTTEIVTKQPSTLHTSDSGSWTFGRSFSDFEPQYFMSEGSQTDPFFLKLESQVSTDSSVVAMLGEHQEKLCEACRTVLQKLQAHSRSVQDSEATTESMDLGSEASHISIDVTAPDPEPSMKDPEKMDVEVSGRRLSYLDIMEMLERSESVPDYIERNIDLPSEHKMMNLLVMASDALQRSESMPEDPNSSFDWCGQIPDTIPGGKQLSLQETSSTFDRQDSWAVVYHGQSNGNEDTGVASNGTPEEMETTESEPCPTENGINGLSLTRRNEVTELELAQTEKPKRSKRSRDLNLDARLQRFDLEGLLSRIERIENMISAVTSVYSINGVRDDTGVVRRQENENASHVNTNDLTMDISNMAETLNSPTGTMNNMDQRKSGEEKVTRSQLPPAIEQFELEPRRRLIKTTSVTVETKRPMLSKILLKKRSSLQRQSNIDVMSPQRFQEQFSTCSESVDLNLRQRRHTEGALQGLRSQPTWFENLPEVDEDKLSVISDVLEEEEMDVVEDEIEDENKDHRISGCVSETNSVHASPRSVSDQDIDTEIAKMRHQLQLMSSESSVTSGPYMSLFEKFNVDMSALPSVSQFPSSITKGVLKSLSGSEHHFGTASEISDQDEPLPTADLRESIQQYSKKLESMFVLEKRRKMFQMSKSKSSSLRSTRSQPLRKLKAKSKREMFMSGNGMSHGSHELSFSSFEKTSAKTFDRKTKRKPKDINEFQRLFVGASQSSEMDEHDGADQKRKPNDINEFQRFFVGDREVDEGDVAENKTKPRDINEFQRMLMDISSELDSSPGSKTPETGNIKSFQRMLVRFSTEIKDSSVDVSASQAGSSVDMEEQAAYVIDNDHPVLQHVDPQDGEQVQLQGVEEPMSSENASPDTIIAPSLTTQIARKLYSQRSLTSRSQVDEDEIENRKNQTQCRVSGPPSVRPLLMRYTSVADDSVPMESEKTANPSIVMRLCPDEIIEQVDLPNGSEYDTLKVEQDCSALSTSSMDVSPSCSSPIPIIEEDASSVVPEKIGDLSLSLCESSPHRSFSRSLSRLSGSLDDEKSLGSETERLAADIADDIYDNIHKQIEGRTEYMSDIELNYTILKAVNTTMDKLLEGQDDVPLGWPEVQAAL